MIFVKKFTNYSHQLWYQKFTHLTSRLHDCRQISILEMGCIPVIPIWQHLTEIPEKQADLKDDNGIVLNMTVVMMLILLIGETYWTKLYLFCLARDKLHSSILFCLWKANSSIHAAALLAFLKFHLSCLFNRSRRCRPIGTDPCHWKFYAKF